ALPRTPRANRDKTPETPNSIIPHRPEYTPGLDPDPLRARRPNADNPPRRSGVAGNDQPARQGAHWTASISSVRQITWPSLPPLSLRVCYLPFAPLVNVRRSLKRPRAG